MSVADVLSSPPDVSAETPNKIRDLDGFEEVFWLLEQSLPYFHVVAATIDGATTVVEWRRALSLVEGRYPLALASIRKTPGERPYFERIAGRKVPLTVEELGDATVLTDEMEKELNRSMGDSSGSLLRIRLFHGKERSLLLIAAHHAIFDGRSSMQMLQDLLAAVVGEEVADTVYATPSLSSVFGQPAPESYTTRLEAGVTSEGLIDVPAIQVRRMVLERNETELLIRWAKLEGTTVHCALVAALTHAGASTAEEWRVRPVRCMTTVDARRRQNLQDVAGLLITGLLHDVDAQEELPFWERARRIGSMLTPERLDDAALGTIKQFRELVAKERTPRSFLQVLMAGSGSDLMLSNYAGYRIRTEFGRLHVSSMFSGSATGGPATQKVSVSTVNGRLGMTLASRQPFPALLEEAREILLRESK